MHHRLMDRVDPFLEGRNAAVVIEISIRPIVIGVNNRAR